MKKIAFTGILALAAGLSGLMAQQGAAPKQSAPQEAAPPAQKGPAPKSEGEKAALGAIQTAASNQDADAIIQACEDLVTKFADTDFKETAYTLEAKAYQMKRDDAHAQVFARKALEINPKAYQMTLLLGETIQAHLGAHDLNHDEKLKEATKAFNDTMEILKTAEKPNPNLPDEQWMTIRKYLDAQAHNGLGMLAMVDSKWDAAIAEFKLAVEEDPEQDAYSTRLASVYQAAGKNQEAIAECDKLLAKPTLHPQIKAVVTKIKMDATNAGKK